MWFAVAEFGAGSFYKKFSCIFRERYIFLATVIIPRTGNVSACTEICMKTGFPLCLKKNMLSFENSTGSQNIFP